MSNFEKVVEEIVTSEHPIIGIIGATSPSSVYQKSTVQELGRCLHGYVSAKGTLVTGGVPGVGVDIYSGIVKHCIETRSKDDRFLALTPVGETSVFTDPKTKRKIKTFYPYYLPDSYKALRYVGELECHEMKLGQSMEERRILLTKVLDLAIMIDGGAGTLDEASLMLVRHKPVIVTKSGGTTDILQDLKRGLITERMMREQNLFLESINTKFIHIVDLNVDQILGKLDELVGSLNF